jgi:(p)ppGpp synthase/HD superfamily hydrolase
MNGLFLVSRAADFAARVHVDQHRKGIAQEPYVNHLAEVAHLLAEATEGTDPLLVAAGWLHDTLEDTPVTYEELAEHFGSVVADIVAEVTDDKSLPKSVRKQLQIEEMASKSDRAQRLKFADKTSNIRALLTSPPAGWDRARLSDYVEWGVAVIDRATISDRFLDDAFRAAVADARAAFAERLT